MIRIVLAILVAATAGGSSWAQAPTSRPAQPVRPAVAERTGALPFLIGADWPVDASEAVEKQAADMGMNFARINGGGGAWAIESHSKKAKQLEERGVFVLLQLGSHWVPANYFKYTDYYFVDHAGGTGKEDRTSWSIKTGGNDWPQFSYAATGDDFKKELYIEYEKYITEFRDRGNVIGVILHNEPGLFWQDDKLYDYNPRSIARFRQWLKSRHETIETLNERWGGKHKSFDEISPPAKLPPIEDPAEVAAMIDWRRFQTQMIEDWLRWEVTASMKIQPRINWRTTTNMAGPLDNWHFYRCDNMVRFSHGMDALGIDIYPNQWTGKLFGEYTMAMARGAAAEKTPGMTSPWIRGPRPVWVLEAQTYDDSHKELTPEQRGELLYRDLWTYAAGGAKAIALWRLSDTGGYSLTKGQANPRTAAVKTFAAQAKWLQLERFNPVPAEVAVVVDPDSLLYIGATSEKLSRTSGIHHNFQGYYAAVRNLQLDADVLFVEQLRDEEIFPRYKTLILPSIFMMDEPLAAVLTKFVDAGGLLIVDEGFATLDRHGKPLTSPDGKSVGQTPGFGLNKVVGEPQEAGDNVKLTPFGKGHGVMLIKNRGQGFLEGWANQPLAGAVRDALPKATIAVKHAPNTPDKTPAPSRTIATRLHDDRGNTLVVFTQPNEKMKPLEADGPLSVSMTGMHGVKRVLLLAPGEATAKPLEFTCGQGVLILQVNATSTFAIAIGDDLPE